MKKTFFAVLALVCMASCDNQIVETTVAESDYGYIDFGITNDTEMVVTRAGAEDAEEVDLDSYEIILATKAGAQMFKKEYKDIVAGDWKVAAGEYTITATNLTVEEAYNEDLSGDYGAVRVSGKQEFTVNAGSVTPVTVQCNPINSKVSFKYTEAFAEVFKKESLSLTVADETRSVVMEAYPEATENSALAAAAYFEAGKELTWTLEAELNSGTTKQYSKKFQTEANKWSIVTFNVSSTNGNISIKISVNGVIEEVIQVNATFDPITGEFQEDDAA